MSNWKRYEDGTWRSDYQEWKATGWRGIGRVTHVDGRWQWHLEGNHGLPIVDSADELDRAMDACDTAALRLQGRPYDRREIENPEIKRLQEENRELNQLLSHVQAENHLLLDRFLALEQPTDGSRYEVVFSEDLAGHYEMRGANCWCLMLGSELIKCDGGEPEDQMLVRDWAWVPDLLNTERDKCRETERELAATREKLKRLTDACVALRGKLAQTQADLDTTFAALCGPVDETTQAQT